MSIRNTIYYLAGAIKCLMPLYRTHVPRLVVVRPETEKELQAKMKKVRWQEGGHRMKALGSERQGRGGASRRTAFTPLLLPTPV